jgi:hypothetical protein
MTIYFIEEFNKANSPNRVTENNSKGKSFSKYRYDIRNQHP